MFPCILFIKGADSNVTLVKDGLIINLPCKQATYEYLLSKKKKKSSSLMDVHVSTLLFNASLRILGDLAYHVKA